MDLFLDDAVALIHSAGLRRPPVFVAIDGRSGAGKSTFAAALAGRTGARLVDGDAFFAGGVRLRRDSAERRAEACIDRPKLRAVLEALRAGRTATYRPFDWDAFDGRLSDQAVVVEPADVVIVEGVYAAHPDLADLMDMRILITAADDVRRRRLRLREGAIGAWERQWHEAEDWYFTRRLAGRRFDLVCPSA